MRCVVIFIEWVMCAKRVFGWTWVRKGRPNEFFGAQALGVSAHGASTPWSQCWSHVVGVFLQHSVTPTGLLMIHLVAVRLDLPRVWWVLLSALSTPRDFYENGTAYHLGLSLSIFWPYACDWYYLMWCVWEWDDEWLWERKYIYTLCILSPFIYYFCDYSLPVCVCVWAECHACFRWSGWVQC